MALLCGRRIWFHSSARGMRNVALTTPVFPCYNAHFRKLRIVHAGASTSAPPSTSKTTNSETKSEVSFVALTPLERLRARQLRDVPRPPGRLSGKEESAKPVSTPLAQSFEQLGLSDELMSAVIELGISKPTEVQSLGIPAVSNGESVVLASHTGSGKTLAYMLPIVQALRRDEAESGKATRARRPRAVVLCPTRELAEQVFHVAKSLCHHARFRAAMIGGGLKMKPQEDILNSAVDMVVGTPGRLLMHVKEGHMAYGDIKYVALDEADTMFDRGFGPEVRKFLGPLRNRSSQPGGTGFQTVLVTATITKAVQKVLDEEFPGIRHIHTSTLHKKVSSARHDFLKLSGTENKLEALQQVLEPSLAKGNRVMVFCNTLNSCRAIDHFLRENGIQTVNYHGEIPAEERVENLNKFKEETGARSFPALVCTDLAARGLDLVVDHVIMFDFPLNPVDYLHRTGRTARMGAKGKVTSLVTKRDSTLAGQIEDAMSRGESLEALTSSREKVAAMKQQELEVRQRQNSKEAASKGNFRGSKKRILASPNASKSFQAPKGSRGKARFEGVSKQVENVTKKNSGFFIRKK
ncbi:ATP-dependent RNA helicase DDX28 [Marchantia polymorpha subsp. ruderalis]|uniref:DEAD-box RNA helicase n=2 Tax=Marchantia polymorpha TaxID=3197 RepID=A0AAF6BGM8_MARPO|nr:hypothetical protein MARPO_0095s0002 [Marchantia polymorpha]BBN11162.1 hypothetical protein Mp_5g09580 [Marchantia polymorpha subsp. ruderalis]|eukprot:PTQ32736.1 hypothetical protein MARPO_0095s0002 [Marchantia polymorpha]